MKSMKEVARLARKRAKRVEDQIEDVFDSQARSNPKPSRSEIRAEEEKTHQHEFLLKLVPVIEKVLREINWLGVRLLWAKHSQLGYIFEDKSFPDGFYPLDQIKTGTHPDIPVVFYATYGYSQWYGNGEYSKEANFNIVLGTSKNSGELVLLVEIYLKEEGVTTLIVPADCSQADFEAYMKNALGVTIEEAELKRLRMKRKRQ